MGEANSMTSKSLEMGSAPKPALFPLGPPQINRHTQGIDLSSKVAIITGGNTGLGFQCARHLLSLKLSHLILAVRSVKRGGEAVAKLHDEFPSARLEVWELEMSSYDSIQSFARRVDTDLPRVDITILNAGVAHTKPTFCQSTGHDNVVQVNYLSTFLLAILLLQVLKKKQPPTGPPSRLTIVSSGTALTAKFPNRHKRPLLRSFDDPKIQSYDTFERYSSSKLLGHLFLVRLLKHLDPEETIVNLVEPGLTDDTELFREAGMAMRTVFWFIKVVKARTPEEAAWLYLDAAVVKGKESHGCYLLDGNIHPFADLIYQTEGGPIMDVLWDETMSEFEFARIREILA